MDEKQNIISLSLIADIINRNGQTWSFNKAIFNTKNIETQNYFSNKKSSNRSRESTYLSAPSSLSSQNFQEELTSEVKASKEYTYIQNGQWSLDLQTQLVLWSISINSNRSGFCFIGEDQIYQGYSIKVKPGDFFPSGICTLLTSELQIFQELLFPQPVYDDIRLLLNIIPEITVISENNIEGDGKFQKVNLKYKFYNNLDTNLPINLVYSLGRTIKSITVNTDQTKPTENKFRRELFWVINLQAHTESSFSTNFIIEF